MYNDSSLTDEFEKFLEIKKYKEIKDYVVNFLMEEFSKTYTMIRKEEYILSITICEELVKKYDREKFKNSVAFSFFKKIFPFIFSSNIKINLQYK